MTDASKKEMYEKAVKRIKDFLTPEEDSYVKMVTISSILKYELPYYFWVWFYLVVSPKLLQVWPYQGTVWCIKIPFEKGVCGACASREETVVVEDVHKFPGHIACDSRSNSEIVVPVFDKEKKLIAVLDVDSVEVGSFGEIDKNYLEDLMNYYFTH